jgi:hypothetical protein
LEEEDESEEDDDFDDDNGILSSKGILVLGDETAEISD